MKKVYAVFYVSLEGEYHLEVICKKRKKAKKYVSKMRDLGQYAIEGINLYE